MTNTKVFLAFLANVCFLIVSLHPVSAGEIEELEVRAMQRACENLVLDYAYYRDRPDAVELANLFTEDARFDFRGKTYIGREKIRARVAAGVNGPTFRHLMSTIKIFPEDADHAHGVSYVTVYAATRTSSAESVASDVKAPLPVENFAGIGEYHDKFVRTPDGWKISHRSYVSVFVPAPQPKE